jgi:Asp-tRNA(Asn)/Glu-tRNA(Gln) amidotransferase B subunit
MSTAELKEEIQKAIDKMPESELKELLDLINKKQVKNSIDDKTLDAYMDAIISENRGLLQRLAQ